MAYLDYPGLAYFKSLLDENYLRTNYEGDTVIDGNVTFTNPVDASVKNDWLGQQIDKTYLKDVVPDPEGSGALALILGDGSVSHLITDTTVTQVRSNANELYPILLCYDASAEEDQIAKKVWYGNGVRINPRYGYLYSQKMLTLHPTYNRATASTSRVEWTNDFRDSVLNPVGQIFEYIDPVSQGGEHRMELRLYGNPNVAGINTPNINYETNTVSLGVSATRGDALTFFGYAPSTPIYLEDGSTMRKSLVRGDQYGKDIITRDWLNLNGSITGLVHTYMDETIDGYKTFLKTVTIDSGDDNNKAGLNVQGDVNIDSGNDNNPSNLHVQGDGDIDGDLNVDGNSHIHGNEVVDGNETVHGDLTVDSGDPNDPSHIYVQGEIYHPGENGGNPVEYISYITNQQEFRTEIVEHLLPIGKGLAKDENGRIYVDFNQMPTDQFEALLGQLHIPLYVGERNGNSVIGTEFYVATNGVDSTADGRGRSADKPWRTISYATQTLAKNYNISTKVVHINIAAGTYNESVSLPLLNRTTGYVVLRPMNNNANVTIAVTTNAGAVCVNHSGGAWELQNINVSLTLQTASSTSFPALVYSSDSSGYLRLSRCNFTVTDSTSGTTATNARLLWCGGGHIVVNNYNAFTETNEETHWNRTGSNIEHLEWIYVENSGVFELQRRSDSGSKNIVVSGNFEHFVTCLFNGLLRYVGNGNPITFSGSGTGMEFLCTTGGAIMTGGSNSANWFPGSTEGYANTSKGAWIHPDANY